jgi:hypothetical protein
MGDNSAIETTEIVLSLWNGQISHSIRKKTGVQYVCMYVCRYVCVHVCVYACVYVCMYECMYVFLFLWNCLLTFYVRIALSQSIEISKLVSCFKYL